MPHWVRRVFLEVLPRFIFVNKDLNFTIEPEFKANNGDMDNGWVGGNSVSWKVQNNGESGSSHTATSSADMIIQSKFLFRAFNLYPTLGRIRAALMEINFIGNCIRSRESSDAAADEWQYVAMVVDRD